VSNKLKRKDLGDIIYEKPSKIINRQLLTHDVNTQLHNNMILILDIYIYQKKYAICTIVYFAQIT